MENSIIGKRCADIAEIQAQASRIVDRFNPEKIILFGSYACGNPTVESDVDLLIIINSGKSPFKLSSELALLLDHTFPFDILVKTPQQIENRLQNGDFFIQNIIKHGKVLYERPGK
ncbi:nucleotidyltransferase domain-containing protein [candidate division KSB1 bacterium]|nr:nucleotidyltransferase domain-containing protein [candidate division KSB1 bacterium]